MTLYVTLDNQIATKNGSSNKNTHRIINLLLLVFDKNHILRIVTLELPFDLEDDQESPK